MQFIMSITKKSIQKYCIVCGSPTEFKIPDGDNKERAVCTVCGHIHYQNPKVVSPSSPDVNISDDIISGIEIKSPIIGTAYHAPEPGGKKFVEVGKKIKKGDTVMIVEAMKTMNHVPSTSAGVVKKILVNDGQPVEFGQVLIVLE